MTQKFTTPCYIRKNNSELRKKLEELGYIYDKCNLLDLALYPCLYTYWHPNLGGLYSGIGAYPNNTINCGTDDELFLAIAALREDSDYMQFFTNGNHWYICEANRIENSALFDKEYKLQIKDGCDYHKATAEEIIEHFKD